MAIRIELVDGFFRRDFGMLSLRESNRLLNYNHAGEKELILFSKGKDSTIVSVAIGITDSELKKGQVSEAKIEELAVLKEGEEALLRETSSGEGNSKILRFTHINKIIPKRKVQTTNTSLTSSKIEQRSSPIGLPIGKLH